MCCDSWGRKESDTTEHLNWTEEQGKKKRRQKSAVFFKGKYELWVQVSQFKERDSEGHSGSETVVLFHVHLLKQWPLGSGPKYKMGWKYKYLPPSKKSSYPDTRLGNMTPPSLGFSRQEYWSGVPLPSPKEVNRCGNWSLLSFFFFNAGSIIKLCLSTDVGACLWCS